MANETTSIYLGAELRDRVRDIAAREDRPIVTVLGRMADLYEDLTMVDHAIIADVTRTLHLTPGQALSHIIQTYRIAEPA